MKKEKLITLIAIIVTIIVSIVSVEAAVSYRNIKNKKSQYEKLTDSLINGHLYLEEKVDKNLSKISNPYDIKERSKVRIDYPMDYTYYNNHYYVYFGIVPVITTFLPYRIITGHNLKTYHSTQIFISAFIIGIFLLFKKIKEMFSEDIPLYLYIFTSFSLSLISTWIIIINPELYCNAMISGMCFGLWSIYFWLKALSNDISEKKELLYLTIGNFLGALVFGCRPPIGFFNLLLIPIIITIIKKEKITKKRIIKLLLTLIPYIVVFSLLFLYNYIRFDNPFEFGKTYQLSLSDSTKYVTIKEYGIKKLLETLKFFLFKTNRSILTDNGLFISFPILLLTLYLFCKEVRKELKEKKLFLFTIMALLSVIIICILDSIYNFRLISRYRMDICWLLSVCAFILIVCSRKITVEKKVYDILLCILNIIAIIAVIILVTYSLRIFWFIIKI